MMTKETRSKGKGILKEKGKLGVQVVENPRYFWRVLGVN